MNTYKTLRIYRGDHLSDDLLDHNYKTAKLMRELEATGFQQVKQVNGRDQVDYTFTK